MRFCTATKFLRRARWPRQYGKIPTVVIQTLLYVAFTYLVAKAPNQLILSIRAHIQRQSVLPTLVEIFVFARNSSVQKTKFDYVLQPCDSVLNKT